MKILIFLTMPVFGACSNISSLLTKISPYKGRKNNVYNSTWFIARKLLWAKTKTCHIFNNNINFGTKIWDIYVYSFAAES